jgi:NAD(P)H-nitrite reductase large subunit
VLGWSDAYEDKNEELLRMTEQFMDAHKECEEYERRIESMEDEVGKLHIDADHRLEQHQDTYAENMRLKA